ncbi:MAG: hypothetical protein JWN98_1598 [Abditibacteriota bacterium]|nr:hypothetical protein [Abditibacteriota bacterium]
MALHSGQSTLLRFVRIEKSRGEPMARPGFFNDTEIRWRQP